MESMESFAPTPRELHALRLMLEAGGLPVHPPGLVQHLQQLAALQPEAPMRFIIDLARSTADCSARAEPWASFLAASLQLCVGGACDAASGPPPPQATLPDELPLMLPLSAPVFTPCCGVRCREGGPDFSRLLDDDGTRPAAKRADEMEVANPTDAGTFLARALACPWSSQNIETTRAGGRDALRGIGLQQAHGTTAAAAQHCEACFSLERRLRRSYESCLGQDGAFLSTGAPGWPDSQCTAAMRSARRKQRQRKKAALEERARKAVEAAQAAELARSDAASEAAELRQQLAEADAQIKALLAAGREDSIDVAAAGMRDGLVDMLATVLERGTIKPEHFAYRLIKNQLEVALAPSGHSIRWDKDILDWATYLYVHGNETVIRLLDGEMFKGGGQKKLIDYSKGNWKMPSLTMIRRHLAKQNLALGEGINPAAVLKAQDIFDAYDIKRYLALSFDETPLARGAQLCPRTNRVIGIAGGPVKADDISGLDAATLKFVTHVDAVHIQSAFMDDSGKQVSINIGYFTGSAETDDEGKPLPLSETVLRDMRASLRTVCTCRHCLLNGLTDCTASGPGSECHHAKAAGVETFCFGVVAVAGDSGGGNKKAMRVLVAEGELPDAAPPTDGAGGDGASDAARDATAVDAALRRIVRGLKTLGDPVHGLKNLYCMALNYLARLDTQRFSIKLLLDIWENNPAERARLQAAGVSLEMLSPHDKHEWKHVDMVASAEVKAVLRDAGYAVHTIAGAPDQRGCNDDRSGLTESWQKAAGKYARLDAPRRVAVDRKAAVMFSMLHDRVLSVSMKPDGCIKRITMLPGAAGMGLLRDGALMASAYVGGEGKLYSLSRTTKGASHGAKTEVAVRQRASGGGLVEVKLGYVPGICSAGVWPHIPGEGGGEERVVLVEASTHSLLLCARIKLDTGGFFLKLLQRIGGTGVGASCAVGAPDQVRFASPQAACFVPGEGAQADRLVVADTGNHRFCVVDLSTFVTAVLAGGDEQAGMCDAVGEAARFDQPMDVAYCALAKGGPAVYAADCNNCRLRVVTLATRAVTTLAGCDERGVRNGVARHACFDHPTCLAVDGETVFAADGDGHTLRVVCRVDDEMVRFLELLANLRELYTKQDVSHARREALVELVRVTLTGWADAAAATAGHAAKGLTGAHGIGGHETRDSLLLAGEALLALIGHAHRLTTETGKVYVVNIIALTTLALERDFSCIKRFARTTAPRLVDYEAGYALHFMTRCKRYTHTSTSFHYSDAKNGAYDAMLREAYPDAPEGALPLAAGAGGGAPGADKSARERLTDAAAKVYQVIARRDRPSPEPPIPPAARAAIERRLKELHLVALAKQKSLRQSFYHVKVGTEPRGPAIARGDAAFKAKERACASALLQPPTVVESGDGADAAAAAAGAGPAPPPSLRQLAEEAQQRLDHAVGDGSNPEAALELLRSDALFVPLLAQLGDLDGDDDDADALGVTLEAMRARLVAADEAAAAAKPRVGGALELPPAKRAKAAKPAPEAPPEAELLAETAAQQDKLTVPSIKAQLRALASRSTGGPGDSILLSGNKPELLARLRAAVAKQIAAAAGRSALLASGGAAGSAGPRAEP